VKSSHYAQKGRKPCPVNISLWLHHIPNQRKIQRTDENKLIVTKAFPLPHTCTTNDSGQRKVYREKGLLEFQFDM